MIGLILCLGAVTALASGSGYITGREYVYKYYGQVFTSFSDIKPQYSGFSCVSDVIIQPHGDYAIFKIDNVKYAGLTAEMENLYDYPYEYRSIQALTEIAAKPFKVFFKGGLITHYQVSRGEPEYAVNLKKGLISLFHLNFDQTDSLQFTSDDHLERPDPNAHYYRVYEDGVLGKCETSYVIQHEPYYLTPQNNIVLNVTKARNYHKCSTTPNEDYSTFYGNECGEADHEKSHTLHGSAYYHYDIRGDRHHYVIEHVNTEGEVAYSPYPLEGQTGQVYINRTLQLIEEREVQQENHMSSDVITYRSLSYEFPHKPSFKDIVDLKKPHYLYHLYGHKATVNEIGKQLHSLTTVYNDESYVKEAKEKNITAEYLELVRSFSTLGYDDIDEIYKTYADIPKEGANPEQRRYRRLFFDVLGHTGTNPAILYGVHLIQTRRVIPLEASYFISSIQHHVKEVTEVLLDELYRLCENDYVKDHLDIHVSCYLSLSSIIYDHCIAQYHPEQGTVPDKSTCPTETATKYHNYIVNHLEQTRTEYLKIAYLKALGNIGVKDGLRYLKPYVEGQGYHSQYYRSTAIWALKHIGQKYPEKVRELLVPLYYNRSENYELRLAAFTILLRMRPALYQLEEIARSLNHEEDDQVKSYVYSAFRSYVNSTHPCDRSLSKDMHHVLRILDHENEDYDYSYSHHHYASGYDKDYDYGGSTRFAYFASDTGYIPRTVYLGLNDFIGGLSFDSFGIGIKQYGLERFFDKLFGPEGAYGKRSLFDLFKRRSARDVSSAEKELREIKQKLNIAQREYPSIHGEIFIKYMGNDIALYHFNETFFENFFREGTFQIPEIFEHITDFAYQRFHLSVDKLYVIPSEVGLPIVFDYKQPAYIYSNFKDFKFQVNPALYAADREGQPPSDVKVHFDGHLICEKNIFASMGVYLPFQQLTSGVGINRRCTLSLPTKVDLGMDLKDSKFTAKWTPVAPHEIYHYQYEPYSFADYHTNTLPVQKEEGYRAIRQRGHQHQVQKDFFHDALGVGIHMEGEYDSEWNDYGSWVDFLLEKDYRQKFYYFYTNPHFEPYHYDFTLTHAKENSAKELQAEFSYSFHNEDNSPYVSNHFTDEVYAESARIRPGKQLYTNVLSGEVTIRGDKERKAQAEVTYTHDLKHVYHKFNVYYDRTPFLQKETEHFKVCLSGSLRYPKYDIKKLYELDTLGIDHGVESDTKIYFGKDCKDDKKITIHGRFETSEEQRHLESLREEQDTPEHYNQYAHYYQECLKDRQHGVHYPPSCLEYVDLVTTVNKYRYDIKHEKLTPEFLNATYRIGRFLGHLIYDHADYNVIDVNNPEDELHIEANFSSHYPVMDLRAVKPHSVSHYTHVHAPWYHPLSSYPFTENAYTIDSFNEHYCYIEGDVMHTFDSASYELPPIDCYKVLAKDCSPNEHFLVLGTKISHPKYKKAVKIFLGGHKIEALPVSDESDIIIRVDGKKVPVSDSETYFHYVPESKEPLFYVTFRNFYHALHSHKYGLIVEYDGRAIGIYVSPYYRSKLCGLCGNYNGQKNDPFESADGCVHYDSRAFSYSFAIPSDTCAVPKVDVTCKSEGKVGCTELRTHVLHITTGKQPQTCFSTEPIAQCAPHCRPRGYVSRTLGYHCLPTKDDSTRYLLRQQQVRILHEVRRKSRDHETSIDTPEGCHRV